MLIQNNNKYLILLYFDNQEIKYYLALLKIVGPLREAIRMRKKRVVKNSIKCPLSGKACINCSLYRGKHFNLCFQDHYGGDSTKLTGQLKSMGYPASARIVKCDKCDTGYLVFDS